MALIFRVPSLHIDVLLVDVAIKNRVKTCSLTVSLSSDYSVDPGAMILHKVPKPRSKRNFIYGRLLPDLGDHRPDNRISMELLGYLAVFLSVDNENRTRHFLGLLLAWFLPAFLSAELKHTRKRENGF